jgi:hypothetical protein
MASYKLMKAQIGKQATHGTPVTVTKQVPWNVRYEDQTQRHTLPWDAGTWTPTTIYATAATMVGMTISGSAHFEMLPFLLRGLITADAYTEAGEGEAVTYTYNYVVGPTSVGTPLPSTYLVGTVGTNIGGTGPAVRLSDVYTNTLRLAANINDKIVSFEADMFGTTIDDASGAGYAFEAVTLPANLELINGLEGVIRYQDAGTTGGDFLTMTDFDCTILDWELNIDPGIEPLWCLTDETNTFVGVKFQDPEITFSPIVRTNATTYAAIRGKANARTYQEVQLYIVDVVGAAVRSLTVNMTGLWDVVPTVHDEQDGEVVMKPVFRCQTPVTQTTTPHYCEIIVTNKVPWDIP